VLWLDHQRRTDSGRLPGGVHSDWRFPGRLASRGQGIRRHRQDIEFQTDAAKVNTTEGWRDMKIGIFARREHGEPSTRSDYDERHLPAPTTRIAFSAIQTIDDFSPRWGEWAVRLGIEDRSTIALLGDGAERIWNTSSRQFPGGTQVLDYTGQSIGSGIAGGAAKNLVGRRLKQSGARWQLNHVNRLAELFCVTYSDHWDLYWASAI
jgi:hypothetical protein